MASMMAGLVDYLAKALVDNPDEVKVEEREEGDRVIVRLDVAEGDWGKVIGKGGRIASAMRSLMKVAAVKEDVRAGLEIGD
jgi:predicted RNA-binding protein YlqC (UPF0109 family)